MSNRVLNLIFKADTTQAQSALKGLEGADGQSGSIGSLSVAINKASLLWAAYGTAAVMAGKAVGDEIENYSDYVTEVDNLASSLGLSLDEASFLMGAMERYGISNDTMVAVFRRLASEGIDPTVKNLGELLEQWDAMPEGAEKGQFAMQNFGEQGIKQLLPWWDKLNDAQKENFGHGEDYIEVTEDMKEKNQDYIQSLADLKTEWGELKFELLNGVIPALVSVMDYVTNAIQIAQGLRDQLATITDYLYSGPNAGTPAQRGQNMATSYNVLDPGRVDTRPGRGERYATGGQFTVGGAGGSDTTPVSFMATPGETVSIGGGTNDNQQILAEMRRLVNTLPTVLADALERR